MIIIPFGEIILKLHTYSDEDLTEKINLKIEIVELEKEMHNFFMVDRRYKVDAFVTGIASFYQEVNIDCYFEPVIKITESSIESGECIDIKSWYCCNLKLSIGTEDQEMLFTRAAYELEMPRRYKSFFKEQRFDNCIIINTPEYLDHGIRVSFPDIMEVEKVKFTFGIAWLEMKDADTEDIYTWFAADPSLA
ncbi:hypothetical protein [Paenibacillus bouchesdurhonensis]|uniref:hypothetical protein n=1 Tax=Paenibacillus bouchesdurhonensis TaxID=1870990 RepID=UPI000DA5EC06|nr:hypothetical protein [Paenibacillus bouchesdurhonensis]